MCVCAEGAVRGEVEVLRSEAESESHAGTLPGRGYGACVVCIILDGRWKFAVVIDESVAAALVPAPGPVSGVPDA